MLGRGLQSLIPGDDNQNKPDFSLQNAPADEIDNGGDISTAPVEERKDEPMLPPAPPAAIASLDATRDKQAKKFSPPKSSDAVFWIEVDKINPNPHQPRRHFDDEAIRELAVSIREIGILQPLVVSKIESDSEFGTNVEYQLIAGERRLIAAKKAGLERVPVIVRHVGSAKEKLELAIIENLQREDLNPIEEARAYAKLQDEFGMTQREVGSRIGKSREVIANTMRLLNLPSQIQDAIARGKINPSQARVLLSIDDPKEQQHLFENIFSGGVTVRQLRSRVSRQKTAGVTASADPETLSMQEKLSEALGTPVKVEKNGETGKIIISFYSPEELAGILQKFEKKQ